MINKEKIKTFKDLIVWQEGHKLVLMIYKLTDNFPKKENYSLIDQMRRSTVSITSNIAEGFSRQYNKEGLQFYSIAKGSVTELENQLLIAKDVNYLTDNNRYNEMLEQINIVHRLLNAFISKTRSFYFPNFKLQTLNSEQSGATLIELMAAITIFTATLMVVMTVLIAVISSQRRSVNAINIENASYFVMETISKEIRTGRDFSCNNPSSAGDIDNCNELQFTNYHDDIIGYRLNGNQIEKICVTDNLPYGNCAAGVLTPENLNASYFKFDLYGIVQPDNKQPKITIVIKIETLASTPEPQKRDLKLQTTISSRQPDS